MYGINLLHLARLVGLRQVDIAAHFGITKVQVHYWARGMRPVPPSNIPTLIKKIAEAVERYLATGETDMRIPAPAETAGQIGALRLPTRADLTDVLRDVFAENCHLSGHAPGASLESFLAEVRRYAALTRPQQLEGPQLAHIEKLTAMMLCWFTLQDALLPLLRLLPDDDQAPNMATEARQRTQPMA
jgi:hypothetical protein